MFSPCNAFLFSSSRNLALEILNLRTEESSIIFHNGLPIENMKITKSAK